MLDRLRAGSSGSFESMRSAVMVVSIWRSEIDFIPVWYAD